MLQSAHRYFVAWPDTSAPLIALDRPVWHEGLVPEVRYPLTVLLEAEKHLHASGLHFYLTKDPDRLPEYGPHVVSVMLEEERCKIPAYGRHVRAVVRNMQTYPFLGFRPFRTAGRLEAVLTFEYARDWALHLRSRFALRRFTAPGIAAVQSKPRVFTIPLGYHSQEDLTYVPTRERTLDTFFAGDVKSPFARNDYRYWLSTSKIQARTQLWQTLKRLQQGNEWTILRNELSADRAPNQPQTYGSYSERMMQSRICLAPRGSVADTFRLYEGLRAGCLVITNHLPEMPFLRGAPLLFIDHWRELPALLNKYARDLPTLEHYSQLSRRWWNEHCAEPVIGRQVADFINHPSQPDQRI